MFKEENVENNEQQNLQQEAKELQDKAQKIYQAKLQRVMQQINDILDKEGLKLQVIHQINITVK